MSKRWAESGERKIRFNFYIQFEFIFFFPTFRLMFIVNCMFIFFVKHRATNSFKNIPVEKYFIILYFMFFFRESTTWEDNHFLKLKTIKDSTIMCLYIFCIYYTSNSLKCALLIQWKIQRKELGELEKFHVQQKRIFWKR